MGACAANRAPYPLPWANGVRSFVLPQGHPLLSDPAVMSEACGPCSGLTTRSGVLIPAGLWGYDGAKAGVRYTIKKGCSADMCAPLAWPDEKRDAVSTVLSGFGHLGDWTDFDTSSLASKVADQITGSVYDSFKQQLVNDLPNIVAEIRPYLRQEVKDAIPTDMVDAMYSQARSDAIKGGIAVVVSTALLTLVGAYLLFDHA